MPINNPQIKPEATWLIVASWPGDFQKLIKNIFCAGLLMENLSIDEIRLLAKLRNVDDYKNISRQELESPFASLSVSISSPKSKKEIYF